CTLCRQHARVRRADRLARGSAVSTRSNSRLEQRLRLCKRSRPASASTVTQHGVRRWQSAFEFRLARTRTNVATVPRSREARSARSTHGRAHASERALAVACTGRERAANGQRVLL